MIESIVALFAIGEIGFFITLAFLYVVYTIAVENDKHTFAIISTIIALILLWNPFVELLKNWQILLIFIFFYGCVGGFWSVWRYRKFCKKWIENHTYIPENSRVYIKGVLVTLNATEWYYQNLKPSQHKSQLISWIIYWPFSLLWNITGDFLTAIYEGLVNIYNTVVKSVITESLQSEKSTNQHKKS